MSWYTHNAAFKATFRRTSMFITLRHLYGFISITTVRSVCSVIREYALVTTHLRMKADVINDDNNEHMRESYRVGIYDSIIPKSRYGNVMKNYICFKDSQFTLAVVAVQSSFIIYRQFIFGHQKCLPPPAATLI